MKRSPFSLALTGAALISLGACSTTSTQEVVNDDSQYWQRKTVSSALYMRGPKAQQMLNRDISRCVAELREMEVLGSIRVAFPAEEEKSYNIEDFDTPERDGDLRIEHLEYHDFETCMEAKGWERVQHVPYDVAEESKEIYYETILEQQYRTKAGKRGFELEEKKGDYTHLND